MTKKQSISEIFVTWIDNFCSQRQGVILLNDETMDLLLLDHAGYPKAYRF